MCIRDRVSLLNGQLNGFAGLLFRFTGSQQGLLGLFNAGVRRAAVKEAERNAARYAPCTVCLLYTSYLPISIL